MENAKNPQLQPLYTIAVASSLTNVSPVMIREYEKAGFLKPARVNGNRQFSPADIGNLKLLRYYLHDRSMTLKGLMVFFLDTPCHRIKRCVDENCTLCKTLADECWKIAEIAPECDASFCPTCPVHLIRSLGVESPPIPEDIPRVT